MKIAEFIDMLYPVIIYHCETYGYKTPRIMMAQAIVESWVGNGISTLGRKYHNYWGMKCGSGWKGKSVNLKTKEEYTPGVLTDIRQNFRVWDSVEEGVSGYFQFIGYNRYKDAKNATTDLEYITALKKGGWATSTKYIEACMNRLRNVPVDWKPSTSIPNTPIVSVDSSLDGVAHEVIRGVWGNGLQRKNRLRLAGYDPDKVQARVNEILKSL